ncbi:MAG: chemotaxis protein CheW [Myxococcales bacterium]|nr:chemotaxis protein CheW [Myxococcales bacterium]
MIDVLLCHVAGRACSLPLEVVIETMRPLPIRQVPGGPPAVLGISIIRGEPTIVVDAGRILGDHAGVPERFVTLRLGARAIALAVDSVTGVRRLQRAQLHELPPLLAGAEAIEALGVADQELLLALRAAHLVPDDVLRALEAELQAG